jgi:hypothetical protein
VKRWRLKAERELWWNTSSRKIFHRQAKSSTQVNNAWKHLKNLARSEHPGISLELWNAALLCTITSIRQQKLANRLKRLKSKRFHVKSQFKKWRAVPLSQIWYLKKGPLRDKTDQHRQFFNVASSGRTKSKTNSRSRNAKKVSKCKKLANLSPI